MKTSTTRLLTRIAGGALSASVFLLADGAPVTLFTNNNGDSGACQDITGFISSEKQPCSHYATMVAGGTSCESHADNRTPRPMTAFEKQQLLCGCSASCNLAADACRASTCIKKCEAPAAVAEWAGGTLREHGIPGLCTPTSKRENGAPATTHWMCQSNFSCPWTRSCMHASPGSRGDAARPANYRELFRTRYPNEWPLALSNIGTAYEGVSACGFGSSFTGGVGECGTYQAGGAPSAWGYFKPDVCGCVHVWAFAVWSGVYNIGCAKGQTNMCEYYNETRVQVGGTLTLPMTVGFGNTFAGVSWDSNTSFKDSVKESIANAVEISPTFVTIGSVASRRRLRGTFQSEGEELDALDDELADAIEDAVSKDARRLSTTGSLTISYTVSVSPQAGDPAGGVAQVTNSISGSSDFNTAMNNAFKAQVTANGSSFGNPSSSGTYTPTATGCVTGCVSGFAASSGGGGGGASDSGGGGGAVIIIILLLLIIIAVTVVILAKKAIIKVPGIDPLAEGETLGAWFCRKWQEFKDCLLPKAKRASEIAREDARKLELEMEKAASKVQGAFIKKKQKQQASLWRKNEMAKRDEIKKKEAAIAAKRIEKIEKKYAKQGKASPLQMGGNDSLNGVNLELAPKKKFKKVQNAVSAIKAMKMAGVDPTKINKTPDADEKKADAPAEEQGFFAKLFTPRGTHELPKEQEPGKQV